MRWRSHLLNIKKENNTVPNSTLINAELSNLHIFHIFLSFVSFLLYVEFAGVGIGKQVDETTTNFPKDIGGEVLRFRKLECLSSPPFPFRPNLHEKFIFRHENARRGESAIISKHEGGVNCFVSDTQFRRKRVEKKTQIKTFRKKYSKLIKFSTFPHFSTVLFILHPLLPPPSFEIWSLNTKREKEEKEEEGDRTFFSKQVSAFPPSPPRREHEFPLPFPHDRISCPPPPPLPPLPPLGALLHCRVDPKVGHFFSDVAREEGKKRIQ